MEEAAAVEPGAEGLLFLPYLTGERSPHLDPHARGALRGPDRPPRTGAHDARGDGGRRVLDARRARDHAPARTPDDDLRAVGGGARSPLWLQLQAEVYGRPIRRTEVDEGPAYGAALLGGVAAGVFADVAEASARVRLRGEVTEPDGERARRYDELYTIYRSLYGALREQMHELGRLAGG